MKKKIFITGANSFIGRRLILTLIKNNYIVSGIDLQSFIIKGIRIKNVDLRSKNLFKVIPKNSIVIHLAAVSSEQKAKDNFKNVFSINVLGTLNLIEASKKQNVKKIIFASSEWIYGKYKDKQLLYEQTKLKNTNNSFYSLSKLTGEKLLINNQNSIPYSNILRLGIVYGPKKNNLGAIEKIFLDIKNKKEVIINSKKSARKYIFIDDVISAIIKCINIKEFSIYNVAGNRLISLEMVIKMISKLLNKKIKIIEKNKNDFDIRNLSSLKFMKKTKWKNKFTFIQGIKKIQKFYEQDY